jgi:hypothetical protein
MCGLCVVVFVGCDNSKQILVFKKKIKIKVLTGRLRTNTKKIRMNKALFQWHTVHRNWYIQKIKNSFKHLDAFFDVNDDKKWIKIM